MPSIDRVFYYQVLSTLLGLFALFLVGIGLWFRLQYFVVTGFYAPIYYLWLPWVAAAGCLFIASCVFQHSLKLPLLNPDLVKKLRSSPALKLAFIQKHLLTFVGLLLIAIMVAYFTTVSLQADDNYNTQNISFSTNNVYVASIFIVFIIRLLLEFRYNKIYKEVSV